MIAVIHVTMLLKWKRSQLNVTNVILGLQSPEHVHSLFISPYTKSDILFIEFGNTLKVKCIIYSGSITMVVKSKINVWTSDKSWEPRNPSLNVIENCERLERLSHSLSLSQHAEQLLFSCVGSKVSVYSRKLQWFFGTSASSPSPVSLEVLELVLKILNFVNMKNDPRDMLNNFCFHVYAEKSLFIGENDYGSFWQQQHPFMWHMSS